MDASSPILLVARGWEHVPGQRRTRLAIIVAHAPQPAVKEVEHQQFRAAMADALSTFALGDTVVVLGDFNARLGSVVEGLTVGPACAEEEDDVGTWLREMACEHHLSVRNTFVRGPANMVQQTYAQMVENRLHLGIGKGAIERCTQMWADKDADLRTSPEHELPARPHAGTIGKAQDRPREAGGSRGEAAVHPAAGRERGAMLLQFSGRSRTPVGVGRPQSSQGLL